LEIHYRSLPTTFTRIIKDNYNSAAAIVKFANTYDTDGDVEQWAKHVDRYALEGTIKAVFSTDNINVKRVCPDCVILDRNDIQGSFKLLGGIVYYKDNPKANIINHYDFLLKMILINFPPEVKNHIDKVFSVPPNQGFIIRNYIIDGKKVKVQIWFNTHLYTRHNEYRGAQVYGVWYEPDENDEPEKSRFNRFLSRIVQDEKEEPDKSRFKRLLNSIESGMNDKVPGFIISDNRNINQDKFPEYYIESKFDPDRTIEYMAQVGLNAALEKHNLDEARRAKRARQAEQEYQAASSNMSSYKPSGVQLKTFKPPVTQMASQKPRSLIIYVLITKTQRFQPIRLADENTSKDIAALITLISEYIFVDPEKITLTIYYAKMIGNQSQPVTMEYTLATGKDKDPGIDVSSGYLPAFSVIY